MNWLAHLLLSEPNAEFRIGNILPDLASPSELAHLPDSFQRGITRHREIDAYTDACDVFLRSKNRFDPPLRRYAGIMVDVFYDHFLSLHWDRFSEVPRRTFINRFYRSIGPRKKVLPSTAFCVFDWMQTGDWLGEFATLNGIEMTLQRISGRLRRPVDFSPAMDVLRDHFDEFDNDFDDFFPRLHRRYLPSPSRSPH